MLPDYFDFAMQTERTTLTLEPSFFDTPLPKLRTADHLLYWLQLSPSALQFTHSSLQYYVLPHGL